MTKEAIRKKLEEYYKKKWSIAKGMIGCMIVFAGSAIANGIISICSKSDIDASNIFSISGILALVSVVSYIALIVFVIRAAMFPTGKYSLYEELQRKDIVNVLEYISEMNCGFNEQYDHLMVLSRTAQHMVSNIYNWGADAEEGRLNSAWNLLDRYFKEISVLKIDIDNLKEYTDKLLSQLKNKDIKEEELTEIMRRPAGTNSFNGDVKPPKLKRPLSVEFLIYVLCTVALVFIVAFKSFVFWIPDIKRNIVLDFLQAIGSDVIAIVFAAFSIKACWLSAHLS